MRWFAALFLLLPLRLPAADITAAELANLVRDAGLDPSECYAVRDLEFSKEDVRFYLTDGYLIFGKPVNGQRHTALFVAGDDAGDAEVLVFPPSRSERRSLARATGSPNLNEHFKLAVIVFTDDTYEVLSRRIREAGEPRKNPERGVLLEQKWTSVVRNLTLSFETRLVRDLLSSRSPSAGFFYAAVNGERLGNFDVVYDPRRREQISIGAVGVSGDASYFDIWTSFESRSFRKGLQSFPAQEYRLSNYQLDATLQPDLTLKVTTRVTLIPTEEGEKVLTFSLSPRMRLTAASVDGVPAEFFQREAMRENLIRGDAIFIVVPGAPLTRGKRYELEFQNDGAVIQSAGNGVYFVGARENWYPSNPANFSQYDVKFRYPKDLDLVVPGELVEQGTGGEWNFLRRRISTPVRLLGFNLGEYQHVSVTRGSHVIEVYANKQAEPALRTQSTRVVVDPLPSRGDPATRGPGAALPPIVIVSPGSLPDPAARLQELARDVAGAFEFMTAKFGPPAVPSLTVSPIPAGFGQGFPGLVYLSTLSYLRPEARPISPANEFQQAFYSEIMSAHEVAHQWWGNVVAAASDQDNWLMEALANYSALLYLEQRSGSKPLDTVMAVYKKNLLAPTSEGASVESMGPISWGLRLLSSQAPDAWRTITYDKGSWIMHMLRRKMGDERFLALLAELPKRYRYATLTTEQFRALAAEFLPKNSVDPSLEAFFDNWVYSTGIPTLRMQYSVKGKAPAFTLSGTLSQSEVDPAFTAWVPIRIQLSAGRSLTHWVRTESDPVSFSVALKQAPQRVLLDPTDSVLSIRK